MSAPISEFSGLPFVAGSVTATRDFKIDSLGRLTSPLMGTVIRPGENHAACEKRFPEASPEHTAPGEDCRCGFYAYHDTGAADRHGDVNAIIEATGRVVHGTEGIRAEKMRVLGVAEPDLHKADELEKRLRRPIWRQLARWGQRWDGPLYMAFMMGLILTGCGFLGLMVLPISLLIAEPVPPIWAGLPVGLCLLAFVGCAKDANSDWSYLRLLRVRKRQFELMVQNYPDLRVYRTREEMFAAHPLTRPPEPEPPAPEAEEDFWTMPAP